MIVIRKPLVTILMVVTSVYVIWDSKAMAWNVQVREATYLWTLDIYYLRLLTKHFSNHVSYEKRMCISQIRHCIYLQLYSKTAHDNLSNITLAGILRSGIFKYTCPEHCVVRTHTDGREALHAFHYVICYHSVRRNIACCTDMYGSSHSIFVPWISFVYGYFQYISNHASCEKRMCKT